MFLLSVSLVLLAMGGSALADTSGPPGRVPDAGSSVLLMSSALGCLALVRRFFRA